MISHLSKKLYDASYLLDGYEEVVLLDYPKYMNIGDSLIWFGSLNFLRRLNVRVVDQFHVYQCDLDVLENVIGDRPVILQGGGNFGHCDQRHQVLRQRVISRFVDNRIIMFPQTLHFDDETAVIRDTEAFNLHPDLHLMWRDETSIKASEEFFPNASTYLVPDMAFCLEGLKPWGGVQTDNRDILFHNRYTNASGDVSQFPFIEKIYGLAEKDWEDIITEEARAGAFKARYGNFRKRIGFLPEGTRQSLFLKNCHKETAEWYKYARSFLEIANSEYLQYQVIITNRLHSHIFATLLRIPHLVLDYGYGKNGRFYNEWTVDDPISRLVKPEEVPDALAAFENGG